MRWIARSAMADQLRGNDEPEEAHDPGRIAAALDRLPQLADGLGDMPQHALRELYESLDLQLRCHPSDRSIEIQATLADADNGGASHDVWCPRQEP